MNAPEPVSTPQFTRHRLFWPLIALIALLFLVTLGMALHAASAAPASEAADAALVEPCVPLHLQAVDHVEGAPAAALPGLPTDLDAALAAVNAADADAQSECAVR